MSTCGGMPMASYNSGSREGRQHDPDVG
jgi:hypothetical protein